MSYTFEFGQDFNLLKEILMSRTDLDYPYQMDNFFDTMGSVTRSELVYFEMIGIENLPENKKLTLFAKDEDGKVVATYGARVLDFSEYAAFFKIRTEFTNGIYHNPTMPEGVQWYSSCQWVHSDHRGKRLGIDMDRMKKDKIWELGGDINYANCREKLVDYHISSDGLAYDVAQPQAYIPSGGVGGAGSNEDKNYFLVYEILT